MNEYVRLELRLDKGIKDIIKKAAALMGMSMSAFVINASYTQAVDVIRSRKSIATLIDQTEEDNQTIKDINSD